MAIPNTAVVMHHTGDVLEDIAMGIRSEDFRFLADILNGLYSDTIAAPVREYATNAWDSHVEAGVTRPIEITLPTTDRLEFVVQDFGLGMSVDDLRNTYSMYGASDKRDSNAVAGQLGLGSKSGLSYAEAFTVIAVKGGVRVVAMVTKDDHGLGVIKVLDTVGTDDPNGVRITIPVDRYDVDDFCEAATNLFRFWTPGSVLIDGSPPETPEWLSTALRLDDDTFLVRSDECDSSYVVMGNVPYPVPDATVGRSTYRFVARLNIGDVDFVPSREDVKHTRWTDETLSDLNDYITLRFRRSLTEALNTCASRWEETMLRTVWKGGKTNLRADHDRKIWSFDPSIRWGRKSQAHLSYAIYNLTQAKTVVITGFGAKNVSSVARERLIEFAGSVPFVIIPSNIPTGMLDGRPNTYRWDEVVGLTVKPKAPKGQRAPKVETVYTTNGGGMTADNLAAVSGKVLYLAPGEYAPFGSLGATVVNLYSMAQLPRITRFVPGIEHYDVEVARQQAAALKAITDQDRRIMQARTLHSVFSNLDPSKVDDPELAEFIRLSKADDTDTMTKAKTLRVEITHKNLPDFHSRYSLISSSGYYNSYSVSDSKMAAEHLFYINARYNANQAALNQAVAS